MSMGIASALRMLKSRYAGPVRATASLLQHSLIDSTASTQRTSVALIAHLRSRWTRVDPVDHEFAFGKEPCAVALAEPVEITNGCDHQRALAVGDG